MLADGGNVKEMNVKVSTIGMNGCKRSPCNHQINEESQLSIPGYQI